MVAVLHVVSEIRVAPVPVLTFRLMRTTADHVGEYALRGLHATLACASVQRDRAYVQELVQTFKLMKTIVGYVEMFVMRERNVYQVHVV